MLKYIGCILIGMLMVGCASSPYATVTLAHQVDSRTDWWVQTERKDQCFNPQAQLEAGLEWDSGVQLGYWHQSWLGCGKPFNNHPEIYQDAIVLRKKFGGK